MSQYFKLPAPAITATNPSVGTTGALAPGSATEIAGVDSGTGNLIPVSVDSSGRQNVNVVSSALPTGAATAARQDTGNASVASIDTKTPALVSGRVPVDGSGVTQPVSAASLPLPTGAATETTLAAINTKTPTLVTGRVPVDGSGVTQPISAAALPLPTGAATEATLSALNTKMPGLGQAVMAASQPVVIASNQSAIPTSQLSVVSTANSSVAALAANGVFTGTSEQVQDFASLEISVFSNVASAANGLSIQQSPDGTNWDQLDLYTIPAATGKVFSVPPYARFFRIVYTNGATLQTSFRLQTVFHYNTPKNSTHSLADTITLQNDAELVVAQLRATNGANAVPLIADASGNVGTGIATINAVAPLMGQGVTGTGSLRVTPIVTATSAITSVASSATTVAILASNVNRSGACFFNESTAICYLKLGATASLTSYTVQIGAGGYFELPTLRCYTGAIDAIWSAANGSLRVTELS